MVNRTAYPPHVLEEARVAGWRLRWADARPLPASPDKVYLQVQLWAMTEFREVVYMEPNTVFVRQLSGPFTAQAAYPPGCKVWAARKFDNDWLEELDSSVLGLRPNLQDYQHLHNLYSTSRDSSTFFSSAFASSSWCVLEIEKNADAAVYLHQKHSWNKYKDIQVVQFSGTKPWHSGWQVECTSNLQPLCQQWEQEATSPASPVTVVTSYYVGPSKHGEAKYSAWGRNMMAQNVPLVIFANSASSIPGLELRDPAWTKVVEMDVGSFLVSQQTYDKHWDQQLQMDPERQIHNVFLYKIWMEKTNAVMRAIDSNPYNSTHYVWVDFGSFRGSPFDWNKGWRVHAERFPTHHRLLLFNAPMDHQTKHIGGGFFGGTIPAWESWSRLFFHRLSLELRLGTSFIADDQIMMSLVAADHPHLVCRLSATPIADDPWFYMQHYLAGRVPFDPACSAYKRTQHIS